MIITVMDGIQTVTPRDQDLYQNMDGRAFLGDLTKRTVVERHKNIIFGLRKLLDYIQLLWYVLRAL